MQAPLFDRIDTVIVRVRDYKSAISWYTDVLGLPVAYDDPHTRLAVLALPSGASLTLWELDSEGTLDRVSRHGTYPIFSATNAPRQREHLVGRGVRCSDLEEGDGIRFFTFWDPDGNQLEACEVLVAEGETSMPTP